MNRLKVVQSDFFLDGINTALRASVHRPFKIYHVALGVPNVSSMNHLVVDSLDNL